MEAFSEIAWLSLAAVTAFGLMQILKALAITVRNDTMIHDLKVRVAELQIQQFHAQMLRHGIPPNDQQPIDVEAFEEPAEAQEAVEPAEAVEISDDQAESQGEPSIAA